MLRQSPCLKCDHRDVREDYNCHTPGNCKAYDEFLDYRDLVSKERNAYKTGRAYESMSKLKKVGRPMK